MHLDVNFHLLLIAVLQKLHVAAALGVGPAQGGTAMLRQQVRGWGHATPVRIHPGVDMICDITARDPSHRTHWHGELFAALQHLLKRDTVTGRSSSTISLACLLSDKRQRQLWECQDIHAKMLTFPLHKIKSSINTHAAHKQSSTQCQQSYLETEDQLKLKLQVPQFKAVKKKAKYTKAIYRSNIYIINS